MFRLSGVSLLAVVSLLSACDNSGNPVVDIVYNQAPQSANVSVTTDEDSAVVTTLPASDPEGDPLTIRITDDVDNGVVSITDDGMGGFNASYTPNMDFNGTDSFSFRLSDGIASPGPFTVTFTVNPINDAPIANNALAAVNAGESLSDTVEATDVDGDALTYSVVNNPVNGALVLNSDGSYNYTPLPGFDGSDQFTFMANDGTLDSNLATVTINVVETNVAPVAAADTYTTTEDVPLALAAPGVLVNDTDVDGDALTSALASAPTSGAVALNADGSLIYTPNANFNGMDTFTYVANDGSLDSVATTVTIAVSAVNDPPLASNLGVTTAEDTVAILSLAGSDPDGDVITVALSSAPANGVLSGFDAATGAVSYTPNPDFNGTDSFTFQVNDGMISSADATVMITVTAQNDTPTDTALDSSNIDENQPAGTAVGTLTTVDVDVADIHTYTLVAGAGDTDNASFALVGDQLQSAAVFDFETQDTFSIRVQTDDGAGGTFEKAFTITVNDVNDAPTDISIDNTAVDENQAAGTAVGTFTTTDADSAAPYVYALVAGAGDTDNASFAIAGDQLQSAAVFDFETQDTFSIRVQTDDGAGGTFEEAFIITVNDLNDAPTDISIDNTAVDENQAVGTAVGTFNSVDVDSAGPFVYALVAGAGDTDNASFAIVGDQLQTAAVFDFEIQDTFSVRVQTDDGAGGTFEEAFTITVNDLNDAPTDITLDSTAIDENEPAGTPVGTLTTADVDVADVHTYTLVAGAGDTDNASFALAGDQLQSAAVFDFETQDTFSIRVQTDDGAGGTFEETFTITVNDLNETPTDIMLDNTTVDENQAAGTTVGTLSSTDVDSAGPFVYALVAGAGDTDNAAFALAGDQLQTAAVFDFETQSSFSIRVQTDDGAGGTFEEAFIISVNDVNDAPTDIAPDSNDIDENLPAGSAVGTLSSTDVDSAGPFVYALVAGAGDTDNASFTIVGDQLQSATVFDFETQNSFSIRVQTDDGAGGIFEEVITITVNDVNDAPTDIAIDSTAIDENEPAGTPVGTLTTADVDVADMHTYTLVAGAGDTDNASFTIVGDQLQSATVFDFETQNSFSIRVQTDDGAGGTFEEAFVITVNDLNDAPTDVALDNTDVDENLPAGSAVGTLSSTDVDSAGPFVYALVAGAGDTDNASFVLVGDQLQTAAAFDFETQNSFSIRVQTDDGAGGTFEEAFTITVNDVNDAPTDVALDNTDVDENLPAGSAVGTLNSTDVDSAGPFVYALVAGAGDTDNASFALVGDQLQTAAAFDFETQDTYSIRVQTDDGAGGTFEEAFTITVNDLNDAPTDIALDSTDVDENQAAGTAVGTLSTDDVDSAAFTYALVAGAGDTDNAAFTVVGDQLQTAGVFDFETQNSFSIRVQTDDGAGGLFEEAFTITVNDLNDAPTDIALDSTDVDENQAAGTAVGTLSTDDVDSAAFTYTLVAGAGDTDNASFGIAGAVLETAAIFDFETQNSFSIRVQTDDGAGGLFEEAFTITVNDLNDAPTDIALDSTDVDENQAAGTAVGTLSSTDVDSAAFTYTLVAGAGDTDNASFGIAGAVLETAAIFDFETQDTYSIRVQTDDGAGGLYEEAFTITVNDLNDAPTDIALDSTDVDENQAAGTAVGTLSSTDVDSAAFTYTLVAGAGDTDNASFGIAGAVLETAAIFDFETQDTYSIRVQTDDGAGGLYEETFTITVNNLNDAPTDIALDTTSVEENQPAGTAVGTLSTTDADALDAHTYTLVAGAGDTDNAQFTIVGAQLQTAAVLDFETTANCMTSATSCSIRVQTDDGNGGQFEKTFIIGITNANDDPNDLALSNSSVNENEPVGTAVGTFSTADEDTADTHTYTFVAGAGDTDNAQFTIVGDQLQTAAVLDFETAASCTNSVTTCSIRVQTDDGNGGVLAEVFIISILDVLDPNATPVAVNDNYTGGIGNTNFALVAALSGTSNPPTVQLVGTLIGNDTDADTGDTLSATPNAAIPTTQGGSVSVDADGHFVYTPAAGFPSAAADSFNYEVCDDGTPSMCDTGTVTITGTDIVWYVDDSSPNNPGSGTAADPFRNLASAGGPSLAGDTIFVYAGTQTTGIGLQNNQQLLGEGLALVVNTITLVNAGTRPVIANAGGAAIMLASNNTVRGLDITGSQQGLVGSGFGTLTADNMAISTTGGAGIDLASGAGLITFDSVSSSTSSTSGIDLDSVTGSFTLGGGAISGSSGDAFQASNSSATVNYGGTIAAGLALAVDISGQSANSVSLSGLISSTGQGISLSGNTGSTINVSGGMSLSTGANTAFSATGGGTLNVTGINSVTTSTATAVNISDTTIGGSNVTFRSISSTGSSTNAAIVLDDTGAGTFTVSGTGASGSGGTIENKVDDAITFNNTGGRIALNDMIIEDIGSTAGGFDTRSGHDAIHGQTVSGGLTLDNVIIRRVSDMCVNGALLADGLGATIWNGLDILNSTIEDCNRWHVAGTGDTSGEGAVRIVGLTGSVSISNSTVQRAGELFDLFTHSSGTLTMNATNSLFNDAFKEFTSGGTVAIGKFCIDVTVEGSSDANVTIGATGAGNTFINCGGASIRVSKDTVPAGSSDIDVIINNNTFRVTDHTPANGIFGNTPQGGVALRAGPGAIDTFDALVSNNTFGVAVGPDDDIGSTTDEIANADGVGGNLVLIFEQGVSQARVNNNTFNGSLNAPWVNRADSNISAAVLYENNVYRGRADYCCDSGFTFRVPGIPYRSQVRNSGNLDITFRNDQFAVHDQFFFFGTETLEFESRIGGGTMCIALDSTSSPDGYEFDELVGAINLYQGANNNVATGPCGVAHVAPPGNACEAEIADDGVRGGADNHNSASGTPTATLNPPHVDIDNGSIAIVPTACTVPVGGIFVP